MNTIEVKIYYEDTDCGNVVYYANYLKYMERGRTEYLADHGFSVSELASQGTVFVVARVEIDYRSSARLGETIVVKTWISEMTRVSLLFGHTMTDKASGRLIAEAQARLVCVDPNGKIKRIPQELQERAG
ncbi:MAG: acyl-CoA thioesterase [Nitrospirae bacterium]|nr:acyl-CoA thioesterase [Nitrospirota bacterium]NTW67340.1 acyl-CoA thioesterase [Nitrospirota bacterium]